MNYETDCLYITIKNNKEHLERIFNGMFIVARHVLGYNTPGSSYPFFITKHWTGYNSFSRDDSRFGNEGAVKLCFEDYPHKNTKGRENSQYFMYITMQDWDESNPNGLIYQVLRESGDIDRDNVNTNLIAQELFKEYFPNMVAFARTSRTYLRDWHTMAISYRTQ